MFASVERENAQPQCPYLLGVPPNSCVTGCREEPRCITDEPINGWGPPQILPVNRVLLAFRTIDGDRHEYDEWVRDFDEHPEFWLREGRYAQYTQPEVHHARKVLTRLGVITKR